MPRVTVIMPEYNSGLFLKDAVESIIHQTYQDWEMLIVIECDSSSAPALLEYEKKEKRIRLVFNSGKRGIAACLNIGLREAKGEYIVRMDADDISTPGRIAAQVRFMDNHPDISVCGCNVSKIDESGHFITTDDVYPSSSEEIRCLLLYQCCIWHPTVILRKEDLISNRLFYNEDYLASEDYDLWCRAAESLNLMNMEDRLLYYRWHSNNATHLHNQAGINNYLQIMDNNFQRFGVQFTKEELHAFCPLTGNLLWHNQKEKRKIIEVCAERIIQQNCKSRIYNQDCLIKVLRKRMYWKERPISFGIALTVRGMSESAPEKLKRGLQSLSNYLDLYGTGKTMYKLWNIFIHKIKKAGGTVR